jgi:hypothetical protein
MALAAEQRLLAALGAQDRERLDDLLERLLAAAKEL